jgi:micrococcal nuclease
MKRDHCDLSGLAARAGAAALAALLCVGVVAAEPRAKRSLQGVVTQVTDGDSLWMAPAGQRAVEVRVRDMDAPEICQAWGVEAKRALRELVLGKTVVLRIAGRDAYGRTLGDVQAGGADVARKMVEEGHAWSTRTRWDRGPLVKQERVARALKRGLHGQPGAMMPRDFRQGHGPCATVRRPT